MEPVERGGDQVDSAGTPVTDARSSIWEFCASNGLAELNRCLFVPTNPQPVN
jgi:hypothetical protein